MSRASLRDEVWNHRRRHPLDPGLVAIDLLVAANLLERDLRRDVAEALRAYLPADVHVDFAVAMLVLVVAAQQSLPRHCDLAELLGVSRTTITRTVDRAESAGLVDRRFLFKDGRSTWCQLTPHGHALRHHLEVVVRHRARQFFNGRAADMAVTLALLRRHQRNTTGGYGRRFAMRRRDEPVRRRARGRAA